MDMTRRGFMQLLGAAITLSAGGIALIDTKPIIKTYFLPPRCGWNAGTFELACAVEALRIVNEKIEALGAGTLIKFGGPQHGQVSFTVQTSHFEREVHSLAARHARLVERVDKLARGWIPTRHHRVLYAADGTKFETTIHGGRQIVA